MTSHRATTDWRGEKIETLADIVVADLDVLFVGLNPSPVSVARGHYHQGTLGQQFWKLLVDHTILPVPKPGGFHDDLLLRNRLGITDIVKRPSRRANLDLADIEYGRISREDKAVAAENHLLGLQERARSAVCTEIQKRVGPDRCAIREESYLHPSLSVPLGSRDRNLRAGARCA